jgi:hypothetical protein
VKQCLCAPSRLLPMYDLCPSVCLSIVGETIGTTWVIILGGGAMSNMGSRNCTK